MTTLRIHDRTGGALALDLHDLMNLLAPRSLRATWKVLPVTSFEPGCEWFDATGAGGERLQALAREGGELSGSELAALAKETHQVIWGEFVAASPSESQAPWIIIRAIDSSFYEIVTSDEVALGKIRSTFSDVGAVDAPMSGPVAPGGD